MKETELYRVLSIPGSHVYPRTIKPDSVEFLPDPDIDGNWWPHPALEASWWTDSAAREIDVVHIHFGYEHRTPAQIAQLVAVLAARGVPLVVTIHDIDNPHLTDPASQRDHHERVRILAQAADTVITLTDAARTALRSLVDTDLPIVVLPHPRVVRPAERSVALAAREQAEGTRRPGVFLKSLRSNVVTDPSFYAALAGLRLRAYIHHEPRTADLRAALTARGVDVIAHDPMDDATLYAAIAQCSSVLLPYERGTHSGWLEMCRDLEVGVAVPDVGCYRGQADHADAVAVYHSGDGAAAAAALRRLERHAPYPYAGDREAQLAAIRDAHARIYRAAVAR